METACIRLENTASASRFWSEDMRRRDEYVVKNN
jgi:hypothetical protein